MVQATGIYRLDTPPNANCSTIFLEEDKLNGTFVPKDEVWIFTTLVSSLVNL